MGTNKNKRKAKIDPAFYKVVTYYVTILDGIEKSSKEGALNLPEDLIDKSLVDNLEWQNFNEPMDGKSLFEFANKMELLDDKGLRLIIDFINSLEDSDKILELSYEMVEDLPEEENRLLSRARSISCGVYALWRRSLILLSRSNLVIIPPVAGPAHCAGLF